ncbi:MAG: carbohydrate binding domain-containing protein, partial [Melioribacteraceae bacterium]|nr:carbohydrate binding domain-containing protein [Melioribacteraceae bacterium]
EYSFEFNSQIEGNVQLNIDLGSTIGTYFIDNFSMTTPDMNTPNLLLNSDFSTGSDNWYLTVLWPAEASGIVDNGEYKVTIGNGGNNIWDIFFGQSNVNIENGKEYSISFDAYAENPRTISAFVGKNSDPWTVYSGENLFNVSKEKQIYNYSFIMNDESDVQARLGFDLGTSAEDIYFDNIILLEIIDTVTSIEENKSLNSSFTLHQNYPNPFNPNTKIKYTIPVEVKSQKAKGKSETRNVKLSVYDILGREIAILVNERQKPGNYEVEFNPSANGFDLSSGIYFYRLRAGNHVSTKKMLMMK